MGILVPFNRDAATPVRPVVALEPAEGTIRWYHGTGAHHSDSAEKRALKDAITRFAAEHTGSCALPYATPVSLWTTRDLQDFIERMAELTPAETPFAFYGGARRISVISFSTYTGTATGYSVSIRCSHGFDVSMNLPSEPPGAAILGILKLRGRALECQLEREPKRGGIKTHIRM